MQVKDIANTAFGKTKTELAAYGFSSVTGYARLLKNANFPGLLFRIVENVDQAAYFGGVWVNATYSNGAVMESVVCSPRALDVTSASLDRDFRGLTIGRAGPAFRKDGTQQNFKPALVSTDRSPIRARPGYGATTFGVTATGVNVAVAVVTPCHGIGHRHVSGNTPNVDIYVPAHETGLGSTINAGAGFLPPDYCEYYLYMWRELPFARSGAEFLKSVIPAMVEQYPEGIRDQMAKVYETSIADPRVTTSNPTAFVLSVLRTSPGDAGRWGGSVEAPTISLQGSSGAAIGDIELYDELGNGDLTAAPNFGQDVPRKVPLTDPVFGPLVNPNTKAMFATGVPVSRGSWTIDAFKQTLSVATNYKLELDKLLLDFNPLATLSLAEGEVKYQDLIVGATALAAGSAMDPTDAKRNVQRLTLDVAPGGRSIGHDLINLATAAEATVMDERLYSSATGLVFGGESNSAAPVALEAQGSAETYNVSKARGRGWTGQTAQFTPYSIAAANGLIFETDGDFVAPAKGKYRVTVVAPGSLFEGYTRGNGEVVEAASSGGAEASKIVELRKDDVIAVRFADVAAGGSRELPAKSVSATNATLGRLEVLNSVRNIEPGNPYGSNAFLTHQVLAKVSTNSASRVYGTPAPAAGNAPQIGAVFIAMVDAGAL